MWSFEKEFFVEADSDKRYIWSSPMYSGDNSSLRRNYLTNNRLNIPSKPLVHTFGLRSPESKGIGKWDAAYVYASDGETHTTALFVDNKDYIGPAGLEQVLKGYALLKGAGWRPMSTEDLRQTANVDINSKT